MINVSHFITANNHCLSDPLIHNEKSLLVKVAGGDENAFRKLFTAYANLLGEYVLRLAGSEPVTQEIVQDVFLKIWLNRSTLTTVECFKAYLFVVARNHAFNCLKQLAREKNREREWVSAVLHQAVNGSSEETAPEAYKLIEDALALLPAQQKTVYTLSRKDGIRHEEIARKLNISHGTVKKHMVLALRFLKHHVRTHLGFLAILLTDFYSY